MNSIWKDLLFLHGHLVHKEDLVWQCDIRTETDQDKSSVSKKASSIVLKCCVAIWPRLSGPR